MNREGIKSYYAVQYESGKWSRFHPIVDIIFSDEYVILKMEGISDFSQFLIVPEDTHGHVDPEYNKSMKFSGDPRKRYVSYWLKKR